MPGPGAGTARCILPFFSSWESFLLRMGPSAGPSTLVTNEHMIFIQDFQKLLKSAGPPGDRQARAVGTMERRGGPDRSTARPGGRQSLCRGKWRDSRRKQVRTFCVNKNRIGTNLKVFCHRSVSAPQKNGLWVMKYDEMTAIRII